MKFLELSNKQIEDIIAFMNQNGRKRLILEETKLFNGDTLSLVVEKNVILGKARLFWCNRKSLER